MLKTQEELEEKLREAGVDVKMHTKDCVLWTLKHGKNCQGCLYKLGCGKLLQLMFLVIKIGIDRDIPEDVGDWAGSILCAPSPEELKKVEVPWQEK